MPKKDNKTVIIISMVTILIIVIFIWAYRDYLQDQTNGAPTGSPEDQEGQGVEKQSIDDKSDGESGNYIFPDSKKFEALFVPQAPFKDWSEPWQNACEEAAILTAYYYMENIKSAEPEKIRNDIQKMIDWQISFFGSHKDLKIIEVAQIIENYLGYDYKIIEIQSIDDIKKAIADGHLIIIPAAGRMLENQHFTDPAPVYHMLTIIGYSEEKIITHDHGTQFGANFEYPHNNLLDSIHDFVPGANSNPELMMQGEKLGIILIQK